MTMTKVKNNKKKFSVTFYKLLIFIFIGATLIFSMMAAYYHVESNTYKSKAQILCMLSNVQNDIIETTVPVYMDQSCADIQATSLNQGDKDYFCKTILNIKLPDKLDCSKI